MTPVLILIALAASVPNADPHRICQDARTAALPERTSRALSTVACMTNKLRASRSRKNGRNFRSMRGRTAEPGALMTSYVEMLTCLEMQSGADFGAAKVPSPDVAAPPPAPRRAERRPARNRRRRLAPGLVYDRPRPSQSAGRPGSVMARSRGEQGAALQRPLDPQSRRAGPGGIAACAIVDIGSNSVRLVVYDQLGRAPLRFNEDPVPASSAKVSRKPGDPSRTVSPASSRPRRFPARDRRSDGRDADQATATKAIPWHQQRRKPRRRDHC